MIRSLPACTRALQAIPTAKMIAYERIAIHDRLKDAVPRNWKILRPRTPRSPGDWAMIMIRCTFSRTSCRRMAVLELSSSTRSALSNWCIASAPYPSSVSGRIPERYLNYCVTVLLFRRTDSGLCCQADTSSFCRMKQFSTSSISATNSVRQWFISAAAVQSGHGLNTELSLKRA